MTVTKTTYITRITSIDQVTPEYCRLLGKVGRTIALQSDIIGKEEMSEMSQELIDWADGDEHDVDEIYTTADLMASTLVLYKYADHCALGVMQAEKVTTS